MRTKLVYGGLPLLFCVTIVNAQTFQQVSPTPLQASSTGQAVEEDGQALVHTLSWITTGSPMACTIQMEGAMVAAGPWATVGAAQDCKKSGSYSFTYEPPAEGPDFIRINTPQLTTGGTVTYSYIGAGPVSFSNASYWARLDSLRAVEAYRHGFTGIGRCPGDTTGSYPGTVPMDSEFQAYNEVFGASLDVAASFGDTGARGIPSAQNTIQTEALGQIQFESEHFFYNWHDCISHRPTFSFGGTVGLRPALVLENLTSTATIANPNLRPMFQDAFGWSLEPRINLVTSHMSQFNAFATAGGNYLLSQITSFKQGDNTVTATPISNNVGQTAMFGEVGVNWKLLGTDIVNAYINKTDLLNPPFDISGGYRDDGRFRRAGDLPSTYKAPESYLFLRFTVGLNTILNWGSNNTVNPGKGYSFRFGIDYEKPVHEQNMPSATRYYVTANLDLVQLFKPSTQVPQQGQQPTPTGTPPPPPKAPAAPF